MNLKKRLLDIIHPITYDITLRPDMQNFTFTGEETLVLLVQKNTKRISLHASNLTILEASEIVGEENHNAEVVYNKKEKTITLQFPHTLTRGRHTVHLTFQGIIGESLRGWYKSSYTVNGEARYMATSQFEEIGAREVFPAIDDPSAKAVFNISLIIPQHLTAISNTIDTHVAEHDGGYKIVKFAPTPKMATYALACIVGEFDSIEKKTTTGVTVRVFVTPGKKKQAQFALETAVKMLPFYEKYFAIPYPLPVLDLIAIPDFDAGAMENWGAITAREVALLVDPEQTSAANKQWVATVIAHELTHMWFGNLVTMKWWDDLWLNEGFASYMEYVGVHEFFPEWNVWEQFTILDHNRALGLDGLETTHPIQAHITDVEKISEIFDEVSYSKGASVIQMLVAYIGEDNFREGLRYYLKKHAYSNAETKDLWEALEKVSGRKVKELMAPYTAKPGYPIVSVASRGFKHILSQERFYSSSASREKSADTTVWPIPLSAASKHHVTATVLTKKRTALSHEEGWVKYNAGEQTFARVIYDEKLYDVLGEGIVSKSLSSVDRMGVVRDAFDSAESGYLPTVSALRLLSWYREEESYIVWANIAGKLGKVENLLPESTTEKFYAYARDLLVTIGKKVGWKKRPHDSHEDILLRSTILAALGSYDDEATVEKARKLFEKIVQNKKSVDTDIRGVVYAVVAQTGGEKEFELLKKMYQEEELAAEKNRIGNALCLFSDPVLIGKALAFSLSEHVRSQDIGRFLIFSFDNRKGREATWEFIKTNWNMLLDRMQGLGMDWMIEGAASVTDRMLYEDIQKFFATHPHPKLEKVMKQVLEQIEANLAWINRDGKEIEKFLQNYV